MINNEGSVWIVGKDITDQSKLLSKRPTPTERMQMTRLMNVFRQDLDQFLNIGLEIDGSVVGDPFLPLIKKFSEDYLGQWKKRGVLSDWRLTAERNSIQLHFQWTVEMHCVMKIECNPIKEES